MSRTKATLFELRTTWVDGDMNLPQFSHPQLSLLLCSRNSLSVMELGFVLHFNHHPPPHPHPPQSVSVEDSEVEAHCVAALCQPKTSRDGESAQESKQQQPTAQTEA